MQLWQYQQKAEPVFVPAAPAVTPDWFLPVLPDNVPRRPGQVSAANMAATALAWTPQHQDHEGSALDWTPRYPERIVRATVRATEQPQGMAVLFSTPEVAWLGAYPDYLWRRTLPSAAVPTGPSALAPAFPPPHLAWEPRYPERIIRFTVRAAEQPQGMAVLFSTPELAWRGTYPDRIDRARLPEAAMPIGTTALSPAFPVPPLAWRSLGPEWFTPPHRTATVPSGTWTPEQPAVPFPELAWLGVYPDVRRAPWRISLPATEPRDPLPTALEGWTVSAPDRVSRPVALPLDAWSGPVLEITPAVTDIGWFSRQPDWLTPPWSASLRIPALSYPVTTPPERIIRRVVGITMPIREQASGSYLALIQDERGRIIPGSALTDLRLTLYAVTRDNTIVIINQRRNQPVLNVNQVTVYDTVQTTATGRRYNLRWRIQPGDTTLYDVTLTHERHIAQFEWTWAQGRGSREAVLIVHNLTTVH